MKVRSAKTQVARSTQDDQRFLSNLAEVLASALDEQAMLAAVTRLLVPRLGDICLADVVEDEGLVQRVDNTLDDWHLAPTPALRSGEPMMLSDPTHAALAAIAPDAAGQAAIRDAGIRSLVLLPLIGRGRLIGVLTLGMTRPDRRFTKADIPFLEDVAQRTALSVQPSPLTTITPRSGWASAKPSPSPGACPIADGMNAKSSGVSDSLGQTAIGLIVVMTTRWPRYRTTCATA